MLMAILAQTLFTLVHGHLMTLVLLTVWHSCTFLKMVKRYFYFLIFIILYVKITAYATHKALRWFECWDLVRWDND